MLRCETTARDASTLALAGRLAGAYSPIVVIVPSAGYLALSRGGVAPGMGFPVNRRKADDPCRAHAMGGLVPWLFQTIPGRAAGAMRAAPFRGLWHARAVRRPGVRGHACLLRAGRLPLPTLPNHGAPR